MNHALTRHISEPHDVYVGRPSIWGNPFYIGRGKSRTWCIKCYEEWIVKQPELMAQLHTLRGKTLGCHCKPFACHADVLARLANIGGVHVQEA